MHKRFIRGRSNGLSAYLSPLAVWALAFGCAVGWGSFVMPGTTFLPEAGPLGSVLGLLLGAAIMIVIAYNYHQLMQKYPDSGGAYTYVGKIMGNDHGFLCAWMLILAYVAVIWANSTALSLIARYLFGDVFRFGFSYQIFGYTVYFGEVLLSVSLLVLIGLICIFSKRIAVALQIICSLSMLICVTVCFAAVVIHRGGFSGLAPAFSSAGNPGIQIIGIVMLAPWAYIGFESISHSADEFRFPVKKSFGIMVGALIAGALDYIMLVVCAGLATPDGFANWGEYIASLVNMQGAAGLPTFYSAQQAMGTAGLALLGVAALCAIVTALVGYYTALSRLLHKMSKGGALVAFKKCNKKNIPYTAIIAIMAVSCVVPFFGRTAIGWIVDITTVGALIVYAYVSISAFIMGKREGQRSAMNMGVFGTMISFGLIAFFIIPAFWKSGVLATESYLILILWSLLGLFVFRAVIRRDKERNMGKSGVVWVVLLIMILLISFIWIQQTTTNESNNIIDNVTRIITTQTEKAGLSMDNELIAGTNRYITECIKELNNMMHRNVIVQSVLVLASVLVIFSIYSLIKKREKQIEEERRTAEESNRAKTAFLSNMSHDIRTPMNAIMGYTALAKREEGLSDTMREYLDKIDYSGSHLLSLINDILDMTRIESGKVELVLDPADLCEMLDEVYSLFSIQAKSKEIEYILDYSDVKNRYVICDKNRISRILINLLSNAFKFTPAGGTIRIGLSQIDRYDGHADYELTVADTGIGMSQEFAERIFEPFERERTSTVSKIQGTGLGMSIPKTLIELMDGTIEVETEKDKGTCFIVNIRFELTDKVPDKKPEPVIEQKKLSVESKKILLVEDNPINSEIAVAILSNEGFDVVTAENGEIALEKVRDAEPNTYAVVLMDVQMPVMDGYEATKEIRKLGGERADIPIIAVSANTFEDDKRASKEAGMNAHLAKPYSPEGLIKAVNEWIEKDDIDNSEKE